MGRLAQRITQARPRPEKAWLAEVANVPLQAVSQEAGSALGNGWGRLKSSRQGKVRAPRFKPRSNRQSIRLPFNAFRVGGGKPRLARVGGIPMAWSRPLPAVASSVTLTRDSAGRYSTGRYVTSFVVAVERPQLEPNGNAVGLDLGLVSLAVTRDGVKIAPPPFLHAALRRIRRLQRSPGRKVKGASNRATARLGLATAHATVADQRLDPPHKLGMGPIREHRTVWIEHLNGAGMAKNCKLACSIADAGWCLLGTLLESRARMGGTNGSGCLPLAAHLPDQLGVWRSHR